MVKLQKKLAVLNAIRAEENRIRGELSSQIADPEDREAQLNILIANRIPLIKKQTEEFFKLQESLNDISTIAENVGESFNTAGNKNSRCIFKR